MEEQQLSWRVIEPGWSVVSSDGNEIGHVVQIVGDSDEDIFNGLSIALEALDEPRYVPSEKVGRIFEDRVEIQFTAAEAGHLDEYLEPPPSLEIDADQASWSDRVLEGVTDVESQPRTVPFRKRVVAWLRSLRSG